METVLSGKTSRRVLPLEWRLEETPQGFRLTAKQGNRCASKEYECEQQLARTDQTASITDVLSKVGDTIYEVTRTEISFSRPWFIPRSRLAEWRREVLAQVEKEREQTLPQKHRTLPLTPPQGRGVVTTDLCPHQQNIILPPLAGGMGRGPLSPLKPLPPLMTCRYCVRYQLGQCLRRNPHAVRGPLYLRGADGRRFLLRFDCKACQMTVEIER